jgi:glutamate synthase (NADPH/NADH) small chain
MPDLELNKWGYIVVNENNRTNIPQVWAGGDIVTGSATVIEAMGAGRIAAKSMHAYLMDLPQPTADDEAAD